MYRRLEEKPLPVQGEEPAPEEICICACKSEQAPDEEPLPDAVFAGNELAVHLDING